MEIRLTEGRAEISGYVNAVGRDSRVLRDTSGAFVEQVEPGTFARAIEKADSVGLMFNHERSIDSTDGGLELSEDAIGLKARAIVTDDEVVRAAQENRLTGWSFGFHPVKDEWRTAEDGMRHRTLTDIDLVEVSILTKTPAYIATSIECRGEDTRLIEHRYSDDEPDAPPAKEENAVPGDVPDAPPEDVPDEQPKEDAPDAPPPEDIPDEPPLRSFDAYKALAKFI